MYTYLLLQIQNAAASHPSADELVKHDPYGVFLAIMAIVLVIVVLSLIYIIFKYVSKGIYHFKNRNNVIPVIAGAKNDQISGEVNAAIAMALYYYQKEQHDQEATVITIKKMAHRYSPWNSKIYNLRQYPERKR